MALDRCGGVLATGSPAALGYGAYEATGDVAAARSYAFLTGDDAVFTTYEGLRDGTAARLLIHTTDAGGTSRTASFDSVQAGDTFEWREAGDCLVRYIVDAVGPYPGGQGSRRGSDVQWMTCAFTGCSGTLSADSAASFAFGGLPDLGGSSLTAPVIHGSLQLIPRGWTGAAQPTVSHTAPDDPSAAPGVVYTADLAEARELTCWRALPDWPVVFASSGDPDTPTYSYCTRFHTDAVRVCGGFAAERPGQPVAAESGGRVTETRMVDGYPVLQVRQGNGVERALEVASGLFGAPAP